jgi:hypothetical protein
MTQPSTTIKDVDLTFQNTPTKIIVNRNSSKIELAGITIGPFEEGQEYEISFWIAQELVKAGLARFKEEETLDSVKVHKIYWKERIQPIGQVTPLPENFYPKLRRFIAKLKNEAIKNPEKRVEYEKILGISHDIVNCRLRKIVSLACAQVKNSDIIRNLTKEEQALYEQLYKLSNEWRENILAKGEIYQ